MVYWGMFVLRARTGVQGGGRGYQGWSARGLWPHQAVLGTAAGRFCYSQGYGWVPGGHTRWWKWNWSGVWCMSFLWRHWHLRLVGYRQHLCRPWLPGKSITWLGLPPQWFALVLKSWCEPFISLCVYLHWFMFEIKQFFVIIKKIKFTDRQKIIK